MEGRIETKLSIESIRVKAYHGYYAAERKIGGMYSISVCVFDSSSVAENYAEIDDSVNYEMIHAEVISIMKNEYKLIEECCKAMWDVLKKLKPSAVWEVHLVKEDVPIKHVGSTSFSIKA
ncbi:dihydroneopterin aldolase [Bacteroidia bacterium]|nr:dihydroneopterin aldolase [Bacteroidia bacterium]